MCRLTIAEVVSVCDLVAFRNALYRLILTRCKGCIFGKLANTMSHPATASILTRRPATPRVVGSAGLVAASRRSERHHVAGFPLRLAFGPTNHRSACT